MLMFEGPALQELAEVRTKKPFNFRELFNPNHKSKTQNNEKSRITIDQRINSQSLR